MLGWLTLAWSIIQALFGIGKKDERDTERAAGESLGKQETENANAKSGLQEVQTAVQAREDDRVAVARDPGRLRDSAAPAARPWVDKPD